jgi:hypothetical protein
LQAISGRIFYFARFLSIRALLFLGLQLVLARQEDALSKAARDRERRGHGTECDKRLSGTHEVVLCHSRIALLKVASAYS